MSPIYIEVLIDDEKYLYKTNGLKTSNGKWAINYNDKEIPIYTGSISQNTLHMINHDYDYHNNTIERKIFRYPMKSTPKPKIIILSITNINELNTNSIDIPNVIIYCIILRYLQRNEYDRIIDYACSSAKIHSNSSPYSDLLQIAKSPFQIKKFSSLFLGFDDFLTQTQDLNLIISGSSVLYSLKDLKLSGKPADVDIYIHQDQDYISTLKRLDTIIHNIYSKPFKQTRKYRNNRYPYELIEKVELIDNIKIYLVRSPYILSWMVVVDNTSKDNDLGIQCQETNHQLIVSYQVILSPCSDFSHVFAGYHSDIVCAGYLTKEQKFVETPNRFRNWYEGNTSKDFKEFFPNATQNKLAYFFPDLVSPRYRDRVTMACAKYEQRGLVTICVSPFDEIELQDVARSEIPWNESLYNINLHNDSPIDISPSLLTILKKEGIMNISESLTEVYFGEKFRTIIETMSCFQECQGCNVLVFNAKKSLHCDIEDKGNFCDECFQKEMDKMHELKETLKTINKCKALVTGGRCGLGQKVLQILQEQGLNAIGTTRFPSKDDGLIKLDLKDSKTWTTVKYMLENGEINYLILSASETLHYPDDDNLSKDWNGKDVDWTNDFKRDNSGVWHKCLTEHSQSEIISPLLTNIAGNASLLSYFLKGVQRMRMMGNKDHYCCIVVTSYEGSFKEKTPFHPITNACKSALEQIVFTVKSQADFLDCHILLADPGWVYTEGSFGKLKGPVPIDFGACQILQPLVESIKGTAVNAQLFRRSYIEKQTIEVSTIKSFKVKLSPCGHIIEQNDKAIICCSICKTYVKSREFINENSDSIKYILSRSLYTFPLSLIDIIYDYSFRQYHILN